MARWCALGLTLVLAVTASAGPREDVLRLLPADAQFCVLVQNLRTHTQPGTTTKELLASAPGQALLASPEWAKLRQLVDHASTTLQITPRQFIDDLFGDALAFAYRADTNAQEDGLLVTYARDPQLAANLIERMNTVQKSTGELKHVREQMQKGIRIIIRTKRDGGQEFFALHGNLIAFSTRLAVIERLASPAEQNPHAALLERLGVSNRPLVAWLNPRVHDVELKNKLASATGDDAVFLKQFVRYWTAFEGVALFADWTTDSELGLAVQLKTADLPTSAQRLFSSAGTSSALWASMPANTLTAVSGRVDGPALVETMAGFLPPATPDQVWKAINPSLSPAFGGADRLADSLRGLGPDWGTWTTPPVPNTAWWPQTTLAIRVRDDAAPTWVQGLHFFATLAVVAHNNSQNDNAALQSVNQAGTEVRYLAGGKAFPPGFQPAFATKGGYLVFATTPTAVAAFAPPTGTLPPSAEVPWVRFSAPAWRTYLREHREPLVQWLAVTQRVSVAEAQRRSEALHAVLGLIDSIELIQRSQGDRATVTLRVRGAK